MFTHNAVFEEAEFSRLVRANKQVFVDELLEYNASLKADFLLLGVRNENSVSVLVGIQQQTLVSDLSDYPLQGSPCEEVLQHGVCAFSDSVRSHFPSDKSLQKIAAEAYLGAGLFNEEGRNVGILAAIFTSPRPNIEEHKPGFSANAKLIATRLQKYYLEFRTINNLSLLDEVSSLSKTGAWEYYPVEDKLFWSKETYAIHDISYKKPVSVDDALSFYSQESIELVEHTFAELIKHNTSYDIEVQILSASNVKKWVRTSGKHELDEEGNVRRYFGAFEDITDYKKTMILSEERAGRIQNILDNINDAVVSISAKGIIKQCNDITLSMFGYAKNELVGQSVEVLMPEPYASNHSRYMANYERTGNAKIIGTGRQLPAKRKDGSVFQMELSLSESTDLGEKIYIGVVRDISERIAAQDTIYNLAYTDSVTHLRNSQWFQKECKDLILRAAIHHEYMHILLLDMDNMAQINTRLGYNNANNALRAIAEKLLFIIGHDYHIYKFAGDSFIVLSKKTYKKADIHHFNASMIENALINPRHYDVDLSGVNVSMSASLGSAIFEASKQNYERMINVLENAVKRAKKSAPFGLCHISEDGMEELDRYLAIKLHLRQAVAKDELLLALQPQVNHSGETTSFEALVRWHSAELGVVSPADFISIAEESHVICDIGNWVIDETLNALKRFIARGLDLCVAINISAKQIVLPDFASSLIARINYYGIPSQMLILELTETALVVDIETVKNTMNELANYGFRFSIDDFGTGYSSLAYLKELPISELKIDKIFIDDIDNNSAKKGAPIVDAIIEMARALNVTSIAEGVETQEQVDYLTSKGCNRFQGYYFSKPQFVQHWHNSELG
ncbi:EAL and GGDEF domain-containing protein [Alteromonas hispanica]|uniref:Sensor protein FixL n=1 Tax=Alteromonas hispanica TaxID=315421 RepID=A0A6L9MX53_9ALTE|nr:GGDEF domain-containing phosphodiesterase [Alteromonas hispanica]NDW22802.1 EAL domain-containing protein [Alteromonas hispanica]